MAIYKMVGDKERLEEVAISSFGEEGVMERADLQRILRDQPEVLEEGLLIISEEYGNWQDSNRRIDLLALDADGRLVVIELKRGDTGSHMDLQAIRYAAMVSTLTMQQAVAAHEAHLNRLGIEEDAEERLRQHLEEAELEDIYSAKPRIMLVSEGFSSELTTCALWLNDNGMDVTCIRIQPHRSGSELLIETSQMIPFPEAQDYLVKVRTREEEQGRERQAVMGNFTKGGASFRDSIISAKVEDQSQLRKLYDWAEGLEKEGLATLSTYSHRHRFNLLVGLPIGNNPNLVRVIKHRTALRVQRGYLEQFSPEAAHALQDLIGQPIVGRGGSFNIKLENITEDYLQAFAQAYREANGLTPVEETP